jgi:hypothetical protein
MLTLSGSVAILAVAACTKQGGSPSQGAVVCAKPEKMTEAEVNLRAVQHYTETSPDPQKVCAGCAFFKADVQGSCGSCDLFKGPANRGGKCDSWSPKA